MVAADETYVVTFDTGFIGRWREQTIEAHVARARLAHKRRYQFLRRPPRQTIFRIIGICAAVMAAVQILIGRDSVTVLFLLTCSSVILVCSSNRFIDWLGSNVVNRVRSQIATILRKFADELEAKSPYEVRFEFLGDERIVVVAGLDKRFTIDVAKATTAIETENLFVIFSRFRNLGRVAFVDATQRAVAAGFLRRSGVEILSLEDTSRQGSAEGRDER